MGTRTDATYGGTVATGLWPVPDVRLGPDEDSHGSALRGIGRSRWCRVSTRTAHRAVATTCAINPKHIRQAPLHHLPERWNHEIGMRFHAAARQTFRTATRRTLRAH